MADEITRRQWDLAYSLIRDVRDHPHLVELAGKLPQEIVAQLRAAHDAEPDGYDCAAHGEGLACCVDILCADPADYSPEHLTEAEQIIKQPRPPHQR